MLRSKECDLLHTNLRCVQNSVHGGSAGWPHETWGTVSTFATKIEIIITTKKHKVLSSCCQLCTGSNNAMCDSYWRIFLQLSRGILDSVLKKRMDGNLNTKGRMYFFLILACNKLGLHVILIPWETWSIAFTFSKLCSQRANSAA